MVATYNKEILKTTMKFIYFIISVDGEMETGSQLKVVWLS